jgi:hypothetical protein
MKIDSSMPLAIVCHDAGAANLVIAMILKGKLQNYKVFMAGPAARLCNAALPDVAICDSLQSALDGVELLISGTGWESGIEHQARKLASSQEIRSVAVIDHWVNYLERFIRQDEMILPDELWVTDEYAYKIALLEFPETTIQQIPNYYAQMQLDEINSIDNNKNNPELLYVLEPTRSDWGRCIAGEFQALDYFVSQLKNLNLPAETIIRIRPHPSDPAGKYSNWIRDNASLNFQLDETDEIAESIGRATWVAGCESFALTLALMSGRKTFCTLPPWAPPCRLPHPDLVHIGNMI